MGIGELIVVDDVSGGGEDGRGDDVLRDAGLSWELPGYGDERSLGTSISVVDEVTSGLFLRSGEPDESE